MHVFAIKGSVQRRTIREMEVSNGNECPQEHSLYSQDTLDNQQDHREHQEKQTRKGTEDGMA